MGTWKVYKRSGGEAEANIQAEAYKIDELKAQIKLHESAISMHLYQLEMAQRALSELNQLTPNP